MTSFLSPRSLRLVAPTAVLALAVTLTGCGSSTESHDMGSMSTPAASSAPAPAGATSATPAAGAHNEADVTFATMMVPHHTQAVEMSDLLLTKTGVDPAVTDLATRIKAAQAPEIAQMNGWLAGWGADPAMGGMGGMDHGGDDGMMTQAEMDALGSAEGEAAATLFLTGMTKHHQGAVAMAQTELDQGSNPDAKQLAETIIATQNAEITEMAKFLAG